MLWKILRFVLFLAAYAGWMWYFQRAFSRVQQSAGKDQGWWQNVLSSLVSLVGMIVFLWALSGFFDLKVYGLLLAGSLAGGVLAAVLKGFVGRPEPQARARMFTAGAELGHKKPWAMVAMFALSLIVTIGFPILSGINYFSSSEADLTRRAFQSVLLFILVSQLLTLTWFPSILASPNLDGDTRVHFLVAQVGGLIPVAVYLSLFFWACGWTGTGIRQNLGPISVGVSPLLIGVLAAYFIGVVLIPFLMGMHQHKTHVIALLEKRKEWIDRFVGIVETPVGFTYETKLVELQAALNQERESWIASDKWVKEGVSAEQGAPSDTFRPVTEPFLESRQLDPRFQYLDWLMEFSGKVEEARADLQNRKREKAKEKDGKEWAEFFAKRRSKLDADIAVSASTKAPLALVLGAVGAPLLSTVVGKFGEWIWSAFLEQAPK